ncbi:MAG: MFS transporter [Sphingobacteriia bacterium]|nr:MAG: MFS transporter [Sphingobacteriia bacterium]
MNETKTLRKVITASSMGTLIEWYDFYIFGSLATVIASQFFPKTNPTAALLSTLATFAAGFIVRPFGALVFGRLGDIIGRKHTFLLTLVIMGGSTFAIGLIPGFDSIGYAAPILVLLLRLLQGLALGGEYGGAATYVAEHAPEHKRGFYTSWIQTTATLGLFVSLGVILLTRHSLDANAAKSIAKFNDWGWRIPFLVSILLVIVSIYIRLKMKESPLFTELKASGKTSVNPIKESFGHKTNLKMVLLALFGATMGQGVVWYTGQFYAQSFIENVCKIDFDQSRTLIIWAILFGTPFFVVFGAWSDKIGRKWIMLTGMFLAIISYHFLFNSLLQIAETEATTTYIGETMVRTLSGIAYWKMVGIVFIMIIYVTMVYGPIAAFLVELFPTKIRYTSMSLPYHIGNGVFGGLTPFIATLLTTIYTDDKLAGLMYPIIVSSICLVIGTLYIQNKIDPPIEA